MCKYIFMNHTDLYQTPELVISVDAFSDSENEYYCYLRPRLWKDKLFSPISLSMPAIVPLQSILRYRQSVTNPYFEKLKVCRISKCLPVGSKYSLE